MVVSWSHGLTCCCCCPSVWCGVLCCCLSVWCGMLQAVELLGETGHMDEALRELAELSQHLQKEQRAGPSR